MIFRQKNQFVIYRKHKFQQIKKGKLTFEQDEYIHPE